MSLVPRFVYGDLDLTEWPFAIEFGSDFGNPENVVDVVQTLLHDGEVLHSDRRTNRTLTLTVLVEEADLLALAEAEASLIAEADKQRNTLAVEPGDGIGPTTVFETFRAQPRWVRDDDMEQNGFRRYVLEIPALPHPRSVDKIIDDADTAPNDPGTVVNACESTAGWSSTDAGSGSVFGSPAAPAVDSVVFHGGTGSVRCEAWQWSSGEYDSAGDLVAFGRNLDTVTGLSIDTATGGYMSVWVRPEWPLGAGPGHRTEVEEVRMWTSGGPSGGEVVEASAAETDADGFVRYAWPVAAGLTVTGLQFQVVQWRYGFQTARVGVNYDEVSLSTAASTDSQIVKSFTVEGSARAGGSLHVASPVGGAALGRVLVVTVPAVDVAAGFRPDVRRWVVSGSTTVDATALHGSYFVAGDPVFEVPVSMLQPGAYSVVALAKSVGVLGVTSQLVTGGVAVGPVSEAQISVPVPSSDWHFYTLGTVYLPALPMLNPESTDVVRVEFTGSAPLADAFLVPAGADFSIVDCGVGTVSTAEASSHLWIDSPSPSQPRGGWWRGPEAERVSAKSAWPDVKKLGRHSFVPGAMNAYLVATEAAGPRIELDYFPNWFGNAGL